MTVHDRTLGLRTMSLMERPVDQNARLADNRCAFDSVAADYDGPRGNNALIQRMRDEMWRAVTRTFPAGSRLLDLGCGTGLDAVHLAGLGYDVLATDWSPKMVERTRVRARQAGLGHRVNVAVLGIQELERLSGDQFDGIYSNLGPLNCVTDMDTVARDCASLLRPGGRIVVSVIGRICPWEYAYYTLRGNPARARLRFAQGPVPINLNRHTLWAAYYGPREFYHAFARQFRLSRYRGLCLFLPPPYLIDYWARWPRLGSLLGWLDDRLGALPLLREAGDHFLMTLTKND